MAFGPQQWNTTSKLGRPKHRLSQDNSVSGRKNSIQFFEFWEKLKPDQTELCEIRIYRHMPAIDFKLVEPNRKDIVYARLDGKIPFKSEDYQEYFAERYGAGEYSVTMNEAGAAHPVCKAIFTSSTDFDAYPPKIDLKTLVRGVQKNAGYLEWLKRTGTALPWEEEGEEGDMANGDALKTVTDAFVRVSETAVEKTKEVADARISAYEKQGPSEEATATNAAIELVSSAANHMIKMVTDNAGKSYDPVEMIKATADILDRDKGAHDAGSQVIEMTRMMLDSAQKNADRIIDNQQRQIDMLIEERRADRTAAAVPANPQKSLMDTLREAKETIDMFRTIGGGNGNSQAAAPAGPPEKSFGTALIEALPSIMPVLGGVLGQFMTLMNQRAAAGPPLPQQQQQFQNPPLPAAAPQQQQQPNANPWQTFIRQFTQPFLAHFFPTSDATQYNGFSLAEFVLTDGLNAGVTTNGRMVYMTIKEQLGMQGLDALIRSHHEIWSKVQGLPQRYQGFLKEFLSYDEYMAAQQDGETGADLHNGNAAAPESAAAAAAGYPGPDLPTLTA